MEERTEKPNVGQVEWESKVKEWLSTLPKDHNLSMNEVETWLNTNTCSLPDHLKNLAQLDLLESFTAIHTSLHSHSQTVKQVNRSENPAQFQRTDLWRPVYSWLESLDLDEIIKSKDISDWLAANPEVCDELCSKHSRYHLMHYIKKCHIKILKKKGVQQKPNKATAMTVKHLDIPIVAATVPSNPLMNVAKDSDLYQVKRQEALRKYEILIDLEKQLSAIIPKKNAVENPR